MNAKKIEQNKQYEITVGKNSTVVRVIEIERRINGTLVFQCENVKTGKSMSVAAPERFLREIKPEKKKSLKEVIESKGITVIPKGRRATSTMRDLDDPTFTRKHRVDEKSVLVLEANDETDNETKKGHAKGGKPKGQMSGLDAAHRVLLEAGRPMNAREITETAMRNGYCELNGKTPAMTISAAIQREIKVKQAESRFVKADRGQFAAR